MNRLLIEKTCRSRLTPFLLFIALVSATAHCYHLHNAILLKEVTHNIICLSWFTFSSLSLVSNAWAYEYDLPIDVNVLCIAYNTQKRVHLGFEGSRPPVICQNFCYLTLFTMMKR